MTGAGGGRHIPPALTVPDLARFWRSVSRSEVAEVSRSCPRCKGVAGEGRRAARAAVVAVPDSPPTPRAKSAHTLTPSLSMAIRSINRLTSRSGCSHWGIEKSLNQLASALISSTTLLYTEVGVDKRIYCYHILHKKFINIFLLKSSGLPRRYHFNRPTKSS